MSQARNKRQNNVRAGVFVTVSLVLGLVVFSILTNAWEQMFQSTSMYKVTFQVEEGIGMLSHGSQVKLGGVPIGTVLSVSPIVTKGNPTSIIEIEFELDSQYTLFDNAVIYSKSGLLGATGWLAIQDVGDGTIATTKTALQGSTQTLIAQLIGTETEANISKSIASLKKISESLSSDGGALNILLGDEQAESVKVTIDSARSSLTSIDSIMESANTTWPVWKDSVSTILTKSAELPEQFSETLAAVQQTIEEVRTNVLPNVETAMESLNDSMVNLESMSETFKQTSPKWAEKISGILKNIDQLSTRAKAAIDDISASPWRLLYRPTDREIAYEQLNNASWQLMSSLSELNTAVEALDMASRAEDAPAEAAALTESLRNSAEEFEKARNTLNKQMRIDFPNR